MSYDPLGAIDSTDTFGGGRYGNGRPRGMDDEENAEDGGAEEWYEDTPECDEHDDLEQ